MRVGLRRRFVPFAFCLLPLLAALTAASGCASKNARPEAATLPPIESLRRDLAAIFNAPAIDHAQWSVAIDSIAHGDSLFRQNSQRLQVPASNQKVLTTAVAAERLGWDFRYTNRVYAAGAIADGVLNGDLIVVSDGDPTINPRHPDRWAALDDWAKQLAARGLRVVTGQIIGDDNAFAEPGWGLGWSWDDIPLGYGAQVGALQYNEGQAAVTIAPGREAGARAIVSVSPLGSGLTIEHGVTTGPGGSDSRLMVDRHPASTVLIVRGQIAADAEAITETVAAPNPTQQYVNAFREALARQGVFIAGTTTDIDDLRSPPAMDTATLLIEDRSPPLSEIIDVTLKFSRNIYAETLLRSLAPGANAAPEAGLGVLRETLLSWGVPNEGYLARDGSGLSRYDWISADTLAKVLVYMAKQPKHAERFRLAQAVPGQKGTLETRMVNTPLQTRVWAKTGSMSQVRSMSGYLTTVDGEQLVFSILVNGFRVLGREIDAVMDHALARLVEFRR